MNARSVRAAIVTGLAAVSLVLTGCNDASPTEGGGINQQDDGGDGNSGGDGGDDNGGGNGGGNGGDDQDD